MSAHIVKRGDWVQQRQYATPDAANTAKVVKNGDRSHGQEHIQQPASGVANTDQVLKQVADVTGSNKHRFLHLMHTSPETW